MKTLKIFLAFLLCTSAVFATGPIRPKDEPATSSLATDEGFLTDGVTNQVRFFTPTANVKTILNASDFSAINIALGSVIGTNTEAWSTNLDSWSALAPSAKQDALGFTAVPNTRTVNGHALSGNVTVTPTDLSLVIGTNTEAWSTNLDAWSALATSSKANSATTVNGHALTGNVALVPGDIAGLAASATTDATNANNISSGTLPSGRIDLTAAYTWTGQHSFAKLPGTPNAGALGGTTGAQNLAWNDYRTVTASGDIAITITGSRVKGQKTRLDIIADGTHQLTFAATYRTGQDNTTKTALAPSDGLTAGRHTLIWEDLDGSSATLLTDDCVSSSSTDSNAVHVNASAEISALTEKSTPTTSDNVMIEDAAASNAKKRATVGDLFTATVSPHNQTLDTANTNTINRFDYAQWNFPEYGDGTNAVRVTSEGNTYGHFTFSNSTAKASNYVIYTWRVPDNINTATDLKASFKFILGGADTGKHSYYISMADLADSAAAATPTFINEVALSFGGDASGASGDVESVAYATLTSWKGSLTAGHYCKIKVARDGSDGTLDTSTVNSTDANLAIRYAISATSSQ